MTSTGLPQYAASVVVISYNARDLLACALAALDHQRLIPGDKFEVVVVDDGSDDGTAEMVDSRRSSVALRLIHLPRDAQSSRARARNSGAAAASGAVLIFLDGDQLPAPDFVAHHIAFHCRAPDLAVIGLRTRLSGSVRADALRDGFDLSRLPERQAGDGRLGVVRHFSENAGDLAGAWHLFFSCNMSVQAELFRSLGGFDEGFTGWGLEDCEFGTDYTWLARVSS